MTGRLCQTCDHKHYATDADWAACGSCNRDTDSATRSGWQREIAATWAHHPAVMADLRQQQHAAE